MKRIGLTQRAHAVSDYAERRDMLDQRWSGLIEELGALPLILPNPIADVEVYVDALDLDALVLTGGNDIASLPGAISGAPERDRFESRAYHYLLQKAKPILGVCRGAQMINYLAGGKLTAVPGHAGCRHELTWVSETPSGWDRPLEVNSYHCYAIPGDGLAPGLTALAWSPDGTVEAFRSENGLVNGILWHPEREPSICEASKIFLATVLGLG